MDWGIIFGVLMTLMIALGPLPRAIMDKDGSEIAIDLFIITCIWVFYFIVSYADINQEDVLNKLFG